MPPGIHHRGNDHWLHTAFLSDALWDRLSGLHRAYSDPELDLLQHGRIVSRGTFHTQATFANLRVARSGRAFTSDTGALRQFTHNRAAVAGVPFLAIHRQFVRPAVGALAEARGTAGAPR